MTGMAVYPKHTRSTGLLRWLYPLLSVLKSSSVPLEKGTGPKTVLLPTASPELAERLLDLYGNHILRLAYSYLHNTADAEDILQDTLIQYLRAAPSFENTFSEKAWLLRVAANLSKNKIKYNALRETDELNENLQKENQLDLSFVWEAVKELPVKYREVIHLFYYEGYSTAEIARIAERKESTIRSDLRRGRQALRKILKEEYDFESLL